MNQYFKTLSAVSMDSSQAKVTRLSKSLRFITSFLLVVTSGGVLALSETSTIERWYEIEIILFKPQSVTADEELWPEDTKRNVPQEAVELPFENLFPWPEELQRQLEEYNQWYEQREALEQINSSATPLLITNTTDNSEQSQTEQILTPDSPLGFDPLLSSRPVGPTLPEPFSLLADDELNLNRIKQSLTRSSRYQMLSHYGWRQQVNNKRDAEWVRLVGGADFADRFNLEGNSTTEQQNYRDMGISSDGMSTLLSNDKGLFEFVDDTPTSSDPVSDNNSGNESNTDDLPSTSDIETPGSPEERIPPTYQPVPEIDGAIQVYLNRFLHINTQLYYRQPGEKDVDISLITSTLSSSLLELTNDGLIETTETEGFSWSFDDEYLLESNTEQTVKVPVLLDYLMQQSKRVRSGEVHYFDHPMFGLIVEIRPVEILDQESTADTINPLVN